MKKLLITLACIGIVCTGCFHHHHHKKKAEIVKSKPMAPKYPVIKQPIRKENENPLPGLRERAVRVRMTWASS